MMRSIKDDTEMEDPILKDLGYKLAEDLRAAIQRTQSLVDTVREADALGSIAASAVAGFYVQFIMRYDEDATADKVKAHIHPLVERTVDLIFDTLEDEDDGPQNRNYVH